MKHERNIKRPWEKMPNCEGEVRRSVFTRHSNTLVIITLIVVAMMVQRFLDTMLSETIKNVINHATTTFFVLLGIHLWDKLVGLKEIQHAFRHELEEAALRPQFEELLNQSETQRAMRNTEIRRVYENRDKALQDMVSDLKDPRNHTIDVIGISLEQYLRAPHGSPSGEVWDTVKELLLGNQPRQGLAVRVLLLDPYCFGATLRAQAERRENTPGAGELETDVKESAKALMDVQRRAESQRNPGFSLECRLYRSAPILFLLRTQSCSYMQQYFLWDDRHQNVQAPVLKVTGRLHQQMGQHFDWLWRHASRPADEVITRHALGFEGAVMRSGIENIYDDLEVDAKKRITSLIAHSRKDIWIQGITLASYFTEQPGSFSRQIRDFVKGKPTADKQERDADRTLRVLILDPLCHQARLRAYREFAKTDRSETPFAEYQAQNENAHRSSKLVRDITEALANLKSLARNAPTECKVDVRLYDSSTCCFMLRIDDRILVEQYLYGSIDQSDDTIGKEMPLVELRQNGSDPDLFKGGRRLRPFEILADHYKFVFANAKPQTLDNVAEPES